jgi:PadR family transcriptional regulator PadR
LTSVDLFHILEDTKTEPIRQTQPTQQKPSDHQLRTTAKTTAQKHAHTREPMTMTTLKQAEQVVMLAILRKQPDAYGVSIYDELEKRLSKAVPMATIYATLDTLEKKGFIKSKIGQATAERGGRAKTFFEITGKGQSTLNASLSALDRLRKGTQLAGAMA